MTSALQRFNKAAEPSATAGTANRPNRRRWAVRCALSRGSLAESGTDHSRHREQDAVRVRPACVRAGVRVPGESSLVDAFSGYGRKGDGQAHVPADVEASR
jgi:hypothetical protein